MKNHGSELTESTLHLSTYRDYAWKHQYYNHVVSAEVSGQNQGRGKIGKIPHCLDFMWLKYHTYSYCGLHEQLDFNCDIKKVARAQLAVCAKRKSSAVIFARIQEIDVD